ncbi:MAG TPA: hypothetical protein VN249_09805, partial [Prolixibacteraceae bacterium]|nr:hypothetical protein [Prolixibacteraceae bacterium]
VLFSTHIMQEAEAVCDKVLILNQGRIIALETPEKIKKISLQKVRKFLVEFSTPVSAKIFESVGGVIRTEQLDHTKYLVFGTEEDLRPAIFKLAVENHLTLLTLHEQESSMEKSFLELVNRQG